MRKIYAASWNLFTLTAEADRVLCQLVMFLTVFFHWMYKMKYSCYQESSVIHGWFVYWVFGWEIRRLSKSEIRFWMASFSFFTLLDALMRKRVQKSQAILALLDSFQELRLSNYCIWCLFVFLSIFMKLSTVYAASLCTFVRFETMVWPSIRFDISLQNFKKPLDIFSHCK